MPESHFKPHPHPYRPHYRLKDAAADGMVLHVRCMLCRRSGYYLAADLVKLFDPDLPILWRAPFPCSRCGTAEHIRVVTRLPAAGDYGHLPVRRPAQVLHIQTWRTVKLGDNV